MYAGGMLARVLCLLTLSGVVFAQSGTIQGVVKDPSDAVVTGASEKGTWVRIFRPPVEGKLIRGTEALDVGDRLRVELVRTDVEHGFIDFVRST